MDRFLLLSVETTSATGSSFVGYTQSPCTQPLDTDLTGVGATLFHTFFKHFTVLGKTSVRARLLHPEIMLGQFRALFFGDLWCFRGWATTV